MAGNTLTPEQAYRFARGEEVVSSTGIPVKLSRPLDFLVVADHAEGLGLMFQVQEGNPALVSDPLAAQWSKALKTGTPDERAATAERGDQGAGHGHAARRRSRTRRSSARS